MSDRRHKAVMASLREKGLVLYKDIRGRTHYTKPGSFVTQTILFNQDELSPSDARKWLKDHDHVAELDIKKELKSGGNPVIRARQVSPGKFESLHTKEFEPGIRIVGGPIKREKL